MAESLDQVLVQVENIVRRGFEKAEATEVQKGVFDKMYCTALSSENNYYGIQADVLKQFVDVQDEIRKKEIHMSALLKQQVHFYFKDIKMDISEAISRGNEKLEKTGNLRKSLSS